MNESTPTPRTEHLKTRIWRDSATTKEVTDEYEKLERELAIAVEYLSKCKSILGYDDGDLFNNITRYKLYAEHEIAVRDEKAKAGIAYCDGLQKELVVANERARVREKIADELYEVLKVWHPSTKTSQVCTACIALEKYTTLKSKEKEVP